MIGAAVQLFIWLFGLLTGKGRRPAAPTPESTVSQQAAETPTLAATAAKDEQTVADVQSAQTAQEAANETQLAPARAAADASRADSLRDPASIYADDGFKRPD